MHMSRNSPVDNYEGLLPLYSLFQVTVKMTVKECRTSEPIMLSRLLRIPFTLLGAALPLTITFQILSVCNKCGCMIDIIPLLCFGMSGSLCILFESLARRVKCEAIFMLFLSFELCSYYFFGGEAHLCVVGNAFAVTSLMNHRNHFLQVVFDRTCST